MCRLRGLGAGNAPIGRWAAALLVAALLALSAGCGGGETINNGQPSLPALSSVGADPVPVVAAAESGVVASTTALVPPGASVTSTPEPPRPAAAAADHPAIATTADVASAGQTLGPRSARARGEAATSTSTAPTVEEMLEDGLYGAGASPVHLAIRGTPAANSVRCAWRGMARTLDQRADAIRFWLRLGAAGTIPDQVFLERLFAVVLDTVDPDYRETAKANFLAIARGGESMDYLFLTCFADYAVTSFLLGTGTTPATVTVAYDRMDEAASYDLYVREYDTGTYGSDPLQDAGRIRSGLAGAGGGGGGGLERRDRGPRGGGVPGADGGA